jgi:hypothetical protein
MNDWIKKQFASKRKARQSLPEMHPRLFIMLAEAVKADIASFCEEARDPKAATFSQRDDQHFTVSHGGEALTCSLTAGFSITCTRSSSTVIKVGTPAPIWFEVAPDPKNEVRYKTDDGTFLDAPDVSEMILRDFLF